MFNLSLLEVSAVDIYDLTQTIMVVMLSILMLLGRQIWDMAHFRPYIATLIYYLLWKYIQPRSKLLLWAAGERDY